MYGLVYKSGLGFILGLFIKTPITMGLEADFGHTGSEQGFSESDSPHQEWFRYRASEATPGLSMLSTKIHGQIELELEEPRAKPFILNK